MDELNLTKKIYTVRQVNGIIKGLLEGDFLLTNIQVKGEASNVTYHRSGHVYFSLKDEKSVISCVMFSGSARALRFRIEEGKTIIVTGSITVYEPSGRYQINVKKAEEEGRGELFLEFMELKQRLEESGMFAEEYKKPVPKFASKIGVVTSDTGAVIRDIYNVASRRNPFCQIFLYAAKVQGEGAAETIVRGIEYLDKMCLDVIIAGRGGGSMEDLWCFNDENVARAIFNAETPVISAVGHETDFTIADFVADLRAPTPSAAAELAVFDYGLFEKELSDYRYTFHVNLENQIARYRERLNKYRLGLERSSPERLIYDKKMYLQEINSSLDNIINDKVNTSKEILETLRQKLPVDLDIRIERYKARTADLGMNIKKLMSDKLSADKERMAVLSERLEGLSPVKRLSSGYVYASIDGKTLKSAGQVRAGDDIKIDLADGEIDAKVLKANFRRKRSWKIRK